VAGETIIVDTGVLMAAADADDADQVTCSRLLREHRGHLKVPAPVIPETAWQVEHNLGPASEAGFLLCCPQREVGATVGGSGELILAFC
jgi:hypothetical protein